VLSDDASERFYGQLPERAEFEAAVDVQNHAQVPASWHVVLTDVCGSTRAIEAGRYRDVNALGVASIVGVLNAVKGLEVPYVFGGDGATLLVPGSRLADVKKALRGLKGLGQEAFDLVLRCGIVPIARLEAQGHIVRALRYRASEHTRLAVLSGSGLGVAERWLKDPELAQEFEVQTEGEQVRDFEGFECRWRPVPALRGKMISLLVLALEPSDVERGKTYQKVLSHLERHVAMSSARPLKLPALRFKGMFDDFSIEGRVRAGSANEAQLALTLAEARKKTLIARVLGALNRSAGGYDPKRYKAELVENSDFRKFDETLRIVLDLTDDERSSLRMFLEQERLEGRLAFGMHESSSALMTCLVRSYQGDHVHFVDGSDGGYALAAKELKAQLRPSPTAN
jgi:hypothetical protein